MNFCTREEIYVLLVNLMCQLWKLKIASLCADMVDRRPITYNVLLLPLSDHEMVAETKFFAVI